MTKRERAARERLAMAQDECERFRAKAHWSYKIARAAHTRALAHLLRVVRQEARAKVTA